MEDIINPIVYDDRFLKSNASTISRFLRYRGVFPSDGGDILEWLSTWLLDPQGSFWGALVSRPEAGHSYQVQREHQAILENGEYRTRFALGDCTGHITTSVPLPMSFCVNVKNVHGLRFFCDLTDEVETLRSPTQEMLILYSAKGFAGVLEQLFDTGATQLTAIWANERLPLSLQLQMPERNFLLNRTRSLFSVYLSAESYNIYTDCPECDGSGHLVCYACSGKKHVICHKCNGSGKFDNGDCWSCNGTGTRSCLTCHNRGFISCPVCKGSGLHYVYPDFNLKKFYVWEDAEKKYIDSKYVFLRDGKMGQKLSLNGEWELLKKEVIERHKRAEIINQNRRKLQRDGAWMLQCLDERIKLDSLESKPIEISNPSASVKREKRRVFYDFKIHGKYNWLKQQKEPFSIGTPLILDIDIQNDVFYAGINFAAKTLCISFPLQTDITNLKDKVIHISSCKIPPEKRQSHFLKEWLRNSSNPIFDALVNGVEKKSIRSLELLNSGIERYKQQKAAVKQGLSNAPVLLLQGPPGTGKTTVIVEIIQQAIRQGKRVLLSSQTHQAVYNVLEKLHNLKQGHKAEDIQMVRYAKNETALTELELKYKAGCSESERIEIIDNITSTLAWLRRSIQEFISDQGLYKAALVTSKAIDEIHLKHTEALKKDAEEKLSQNSSIINKFKATEAEVENDFNSKRSPLVIEIRLLDDKIHKYEKEISKHWHNLMTYNTRIIGKEENSFFDRICQVIDTVSPAVTSVFKLNNKIASEEEKLDSKGKELSVLRTRKKEYELKRDNLVNTFNTKISEVITETQKELDAIEEQHRSILEEIEKIFKKELAPHRAEQEQRIKAIVHHQAELTAMTPTKTWESCIVSIENILADLQKKERFKTEWERDINAVPEALGKFLNSQVNVFMATCVGVGGWKDLYNGTYKKDASDISPPSQMIFDIVIVDEAGHATFAETIIPICFAKKVILIGDHKQLPPVSGSDLPCQKSMRINCLHGVNGERDLCWFGFSFFEYLWENKQFKLPRLSLDTQFRMHPEIGNFVSNTFYEGKLCNGVDAETRFFTFSSFKKPLCLVSTSDQKGRFEVYSEVDKSYSNPHEVKYIKNIINALIQDISLNDMADVKKISVAVIAPYSAQVSLLQRELADFFDTSSRLDFNIEHIATVDKFQGSERDIIITSFVRSPSPCKSCNGSGIQEDQHCHECRGKGHHNGRLNFVHDLKRMNVAFSRAKKILILVGDIEALCYYRGNADGQQALIQFYDYVKNRGKVLRVWETKECGNGD